MRGMSGMVRVYMKHTGWPIPFRLLPWQRWLGPCARAAGRPPQPRPAAAEATQMQRGYCVSLRARPPRPPRPRLISPDCFSPAPLSKPQAARGLLRARSCTWHGTPALICRRRTATVVRRPCGEERGVDDLSGNCKQERGRSRALRRQWVGRRTALPTYITPDCSWYAELV